jgi:alcohol dehydrogenase (cytochrome c)
MKKLKSVLVLAAVGAVAIAAVAGTSSASRTSTKAIPLAPAFDAATLDKYAGDDWISNGGDLKDDRHSTLTQITPANVGKLQLAWKMNMGEVSSTGTPCGNGQGNQTCPGQEANAVVYKGIMYLATSKGLVEAVDATNGNIIWKYTPTFEPGFAIGNGGRMPGVSIGDGKIFVGQRDGKVIALDQSTGNIVWWAQAGAWQKGVRLSETPMYFDGEVIEGNSGGDGGSFSNQMYAFNATTGALLWTWSIIPTHYQPGGNTWPWSDRTISNYGGGAMWENPAIDAKNHLVIFGTGNPVPWNSRGPGQNLYTDSIVALNTQTGQFKWGYQTVKHDLWDSDLPNGPVIADVKQADGKTSRVVMDVAKLGWTWVIDTATGKSAVPVLNVKVPQLKSPDVNTWATQPIPQTPNTLPGCVGGVATSYNGANHCYDPPLKNGAKSAYPSTGVGGGRLCTDPGRWTGFVAPDGKPVAIGCHFDPYDTTQYVTAPFESMDWPSSSFDPKTQEFITCGVTNRTYAKEQIPASSQIVSPNGGIGSGILSVADSSIDPLNLNDFGNFSALNMASTSSKSGGKFAWHQTWQAPCYSGSLTTASGLTFVGHLGQGTAQDGRGYLSAVDTATGKEIWQSPLMEDPAAAPPVTYTVNGKQYVSIVAGGESHNDPTRPNPSVAAQRARGDAVYTYALP